MRPLVLGGNPRNYPPHCIRRGINLAHKAHLASTLAVGERDRIARLRHVDPDENFCISGSSSMRIGSAYASNRRRRSVG